MLAISFWLLAPPTLCHPERSRAIRGANRSAESKDPYTTISAAPSKTFSAPTVTLTANVA